MAKHPLKQMSLPFLPANEDYLPKTAEELKALDPEVIAYLDNTGFLPKNFPEGSPQYDEFTYTGRKKKDKATLQKALKIEEL